MRDKLTEILNKSVSQIGDTVGRSCWCKPSKYMMETGIPEMSLRCLLEGGVWTLRSSSCSLFIYNCEGGEECSVWGRCEGAKSGAWGWGGPKAGNGTCTVRETKGLEK